MKSVRRGNWAAVTCGVVIFMLLLGLVGDVRPARAFVWTVTNTNDIGAGSLRWAIDQANFFTVPDTIAFNIPTSDAHYSGSTGRWTIHLSAPLPDLNDDETTIDGWSQSENQGDTNPNGPEILINGKLQGTGALLTLTSNNNHIAALTLVNAPAQGIFIDGSDGNVIQDNLIGLTGIGVSVANQVGVYIGPGGSGNVIEKNVISGNDMVGITVDGTGASASANKIQGNIIGLDASGVVAVPNGQSGIMLYDGALGTEIGGTEADRNFIGGNLGPGISLYGGDTTLNSISYNYIGVGTDGTTDVGNGQGGILIRDSAHTNSVTDNLISGNDGQGIEIRDDGSDQNIVRRNVIGTNADQDGALPNDEHGVLVRDKASSNFIGSDTLASDGNVVSGNARSGIYMHTSDYNLVGYNTVGTSASGEHDLGNGTYGIHVAHASHNTIVSNHVTENDQGGVVIEASTSEFNKISKNSIHENGGFGIELLNGANYDMPSPEIVEANCVALEGSSACRNCTIEIFSDVDTEGKVYEGTTSTSGSSGDFAWIGTPTGPNLTATATDAFGNSSMFSIPYTLLSYSCTPPTAAFTVDPTNGQLETVFDFDASDSSDAEDPDAALQVRWDWTNDGSWDTGFRADRTATHSYAVEGAFTVRLEVLDSSGLTDTTTRKVGVGVVVSDYGVFLPMVLRQP